MKPPTRQRHLHAYGPDAVRFYTKRKTITQRWPSAGGREGAVFSFPSSRQAGDQRQPEVGRRHIQSATSAQQAPGTQPMLAGMNHQAMAELIVMVAQAICLARSGTARWLRQSRTIGPKWG